MKYLSVLHLPDATIVWQSAPTRALIMCKAGSPEPITVYPDVTLSASCHSLPQAREEGVFSSGAFSLPQSASHPSSPSKSHFSCREAKAVQGALGSKSG